MTETIAYYERKLERITAKIERIGRHIDKDLSIEEHTRLLVAEAEKRLVVEFLEDLNELKK